MSRRQRFAQQEALNFVAAQLPEFAKLVLGFDAFGDNVEAEIGTHPDHRLEDHPGPAIRSLTLNERLVDLDLVERKTAQITQAGISRAEIVERDPDVHRPQLMQGLQRPLILIQQHAFGHLEFQQMRRELGAAEDAANVFLDAFRSATASGDRLTATRCRVRQPAAAMQACSIAHRPSGLIKPDRSAIGMNTVGDSIPRVG